MRNMLRLIRHRSALLGVEFDYDFFDTCTVEENIRGIRELVDVLESAYRDDNDLWRSPKKS